MRVSDAGESSIVITASKPLSDPAAPFQADFRRLASFASRCDYPFILLGHSTDGCDKLSQHTVKRQLE